MATGVMANLFFRGDNSGSARIALHKYSRNQQNQGFLCLKE